jgi:hypothetical protein
MSTAAQLKLLQSSFQRAFLTAPDIPCPSKDVANVRAVGSGAGNFTYILVQGAVHFVYFTFSSFLPLLIQLGIG